ncbi:UNVERIFIED_CONTAM: hypothetical protein NCL1_22674 [Trichonephila clavipes]
MFIEELNVLHTPTETKQDFGESGFDIVAGTSGYPNITYPTFKQTDFKNCFVSDNPETITTKNETILKIADKSVTKSKIFNFAPLKKCFTRKKKIFDFYWCDICGDYCTFRSKGFRSHRVMVHRIGVQKYRTWDRFGRPFEPEDEDTSSTPQIQLKNLVEQRHLEWAVKD